MVWCLIEEEVYLHGLVFGYVS